MPETPSPSSAGDALESAISAVSGTASEATGFWASAGDVGFILLGFLIVLSIVVFVHEMGHFLVARLNRVRVETFSIGFGPELGGFTDRHGTRWSLSAIPMGGYVRFFGDEDATSATADKEALREMTDAEKAVCFQYKSVMQRFAIVAAGPLANFVLAIAIFWGVFMVWGQLRPEARIAEVVDGMPAQAAGLRAGDLIVSVDGHDVEARQDVQRTVMLAGDRAVKVTVKRDGALLDYDVPVTAVMRGDALDNKVKIGQIGIIFTPGSEADRVRLGPVEALGEGFAQTGALVVDTFRFVGQMITGYRSTEELRGPITIARMSGKALEQGTLGFLMFVALLSANLGLINLLPIPMLDGGHLVFYTWEALRGRPLSDRVQEWMLRFGLAAVLTLMVYATFNDIVPQWLDKVKGL
ncbi:RIP metalloprotease RseP [Phaeovibrio sulfidiphilus]|uniref:Zinc metalloprotease n=1 Tax=Phaeovibrio sulfidiphilus TaxID=1220600 RepID=A0A8J7CPD7_9PROT|nr:RIP metalloprotease RseP [Phaeovibrio sulfidiphilus]MBE1236917.1 RIP metalloprotease RseP [Phaeovibrio sulfidiphilus]